MGRGKAILGAVAALIFVLPVAALAAPPDAVAKAWQQRAEQAKKNLTGSGLDACDRALEQAFASAQASTKGPRRSYELHIAVAGGTARMAFNYDGGRLSEYFLITLPDRWLAVQKPDSKTLSFLVADANCALDVCTDAPLAGSVCPQN